MGTFEAITLAIIQGLTEFLPVSSSGHLALAHWLFGVGGEGAELPLEFVVLVHLGTLVAVVVYYRHDLAEILRDLFAPRRTAPEGEQCGWGRRLLLLLVVATLPAGLGIVLDDMVEQLLNMPWAVGCALLVTGVALLVGERIGKRTKTPGDTTPLDALLVGVAQLVAITPGISRSGSTIAAGLAVGFEREWATRFAFLMSIPAILAGSLFEVGALLEQGSGGALGLYLLCGAIAAVTGYGAIRLVIGAVQSGNLRWFAAWCFLVGLLAIAVNLTGLA
jgi:undecaprenyl-diphosphatase